MRLIFCLPDSNKETKGDYLLVTGNWYHDRLPCLIIIEGRDRFYKGKKKRMRPLIMGSFAMFFLASIIYDH